MERKKLYAINELKIPKTNLSKTVSESYIIFFSTFEWYMLINSILQKTTTTLYIHVPKNNKILPILTTELNISAIHDKLYITYENLEKANRNIL